MKWFVFLVVVVLYIHLFNAIAKLYFDSNRQMTLKDLWRRFFPGMKFTVEI